MGRSCLRWFEQKFRVWSLEFRVRNRHQVLFPKNRPLPIEVEAWLRELKTQNSKLKTARSDLRRFRLRRFGIAAHSAATFACRASVRHRERTCRQSCQRRSQESARAD